MYVRGSLSGHAAAHMDMQMTLTPSPSHLDGTICFALKGGLTYGVRLSARVANSQICATILGQKLVLVGGLKCEAIVGHSAIRDSNSRTRIRSVDRRNSGIRLHILVPGFKKFHIDIFI